MDYRSELEKKIDEFFDTNKEKLNEEWIYTLPDGTRKEVTSKELCETGISSVFNIVYGFHVGEYEAVRWCFRSEGKRIETEKIHAGNTIDEIILNITKGIIVAINNNRDYEKQIYDVIDGVTEYRNPVDKTWYTLEFGEETKRILHQRAQRRIAEGEEYFLAYMKALDEARYYTLEIEEFVYRHKSNHLQEIQKEFGAIKGTDCKSFSTYMAAPLFKYYRGNAFIFAQQTLNSVQIEFEVHCFDWNGEGSTSWDDEGNEYDRYHEEIFEVNMDLKHLCDKRTMMKTMLELLEEELGSRFQYMDIDYVDFRVTGFTIAVDELDKTAVNTYVKESNDKRMKCIGSHKSFKKDREVISTDIGYPNYMIHSVDVIEIIRCMYILFITELQEELQKVYEAFGKKEFGSFTNTDIEAVEWFMAYMEENSVEERREYNSIYDLDSQENMLGIYQLKNRESALHLLEKLKSAGRFKNEELFQKMISVV